MTITRDQFYRAFGPQQMETVVRWVRQELNILRARDGVLAAGIIRMLVAEINLLRQQHGMTLRTPEQGYAALENDIGRLEQLNNEVVLDELKAIWDSLPDYDWMED
jgi:hypothetical protein